MIRYGLTIPLKTNIDMHAVLFHDDAYKSRNVATCCSTSVAASIRVASMLSMLANIGLNAMLLELRKQGMFHPLHKASNTMLWNIPLLEKHSSAALEKEKTFQHPEITIESKESNCKFIEGFSLCRYT